MAHGHPITSKSVAAAQASYEALGLCYTCGMRKEKCLHVTIKHMMTDDQYKARGVDKMTYSQLRDLRFELANALEASRPQRGTAVRWDHGRGTDSLPQKAG
jgi:hypothetical protein